MHAWHETNGGVTATPGYALEHVTMCLSSVSTIENLQYLITSISLDALNPWIYILSKNMCLLHKVHPHSFTYDGLNSDRPFDYGSASSAPARVS